jgi:hypothetical protein
LLLIIFSPRILGVLEAFLAVFCNDWHYHLFSPINDIILLFIILRERKKSIEYLVSLFSSFLFIYFFFGVNYTKPLMLGKIISNLIIFALNIGFVNTLFLVPILLFATGKSYKSPEEILSFFIMSEVIVAYFHLINNGIGSTIMDTPMISIRGFYPMLSNLLSDITVKNTLLTAYYRSLFFFMEWNYFSFFASINNHTNRFNRADIIGRGNHKHSGILYFFLIIIINLYLTSIFLPISGLFYLQTIILFLTFGYIAILGREIVFTILANNFRLHYFFLFISASMILRTLPAFATTQFFIFFFLFIYKALEAYL